MRVCVMLRFLKSGWAGLLLIGTGRVSPGSDFCRASRGWQTVWLSRHYQAQSGPFETLALAGKWRPAITALGAEPLYRSRTASEANLLEVELPPVATVPFPKR